MTRAKRAERDALIATLYQQGRSLRQIAAVTDLSIMGVRYALDRARVQVRPPHVQPHVPRTPDEAVGWA